LFKFTEDLVWQVIRSVYLKTHRQAFCWIDEWIDLSDEELRAVEKEMIQQALRNQNRRNGSASKTKLIEVDENNEIPAKKPSVNYNNRAGPSRSIIDDGADKKTRSLGSGLKNLKTHFMRPKL
jgi:hypothetical protein